MNASQDECGSPDPVMAVAISAVAAAGVVAAAFVGLIPAALDLHAALFGACGVILVAGVWWVSERLR